jgi:hypothetical protein
VQWCKWAGEMMNKMLLDYLRGAIN